MRASILCFGLVALVAVHACEPQSQSESSNSGSGGSSGSGGDGTPGGRADGGGGSDVTGGSAGTRGGSGGAPDGTGGTSDGASGAAGDNGTECTLCNDPPSNRCLDGRTLRRFVTRGMCTETGCEYAYGDEVCAGDCAEGRCADDPCANVECNEPPSPQCVDADTLRLFDLGGTCDVGECLYPSRTRTCPAGCSDGICLPDLCEGTVCDMPPSQCHEPTGSCTGGMCAYDDRPDSASCDDGDPCTESDACEAAMCRGEAMRCDAPPADECTDESTLRVYARAGTCSEGECAYSYEDRPCEHGCDEDSCLDDPCTGVTCQTPPAPSECFASTGTCTEGDCEYSPLDGVGCDDGDPCTFADACQSGECEGSPNPCDSPPSPAACYQPTGTCADGSCSYEYADGASCDDGNRCTTNDRCMAGACAGEASCANGDGCCPSGCTTANDNDCDPFGPLLGRRTGTLVCSGTFYTRCDPNQYPSLSTCRGWWDVDYNFTVVVEIVADMAGVPQVTMTTCRNQITTGDTCGQLGTIGRAVFERLTPGSYRAEGVRVAQQHVYPFIGNMTVSASMGMVNMSYFGDSGWVWAGTIAERGFLWCNATALML